MTTLFVFDASLRLDRFHRDMDAGEGVLLFPLTSKASLIARVGEELASGGCRVTTLPAADLLNRAAGRVRERYVEFVARIPEEVGPERRNLREFFALEGEQTTLWWFSLIAEKNTFKSDSFVRLAQLDAIAAKVKEESVRKIVYACKSEKLCLALKGYAEATNVEFETIGAGRLVSALRGRLLGSGSLLYARHVATLLGSALSSSLRASTVKRNLRTLERVTHSDRDQTLLVTYYPNIDLPLARQGILRNNYYAHLQASLEAAGKHIVWLCLYVRNNTLSFKASLEYARSFVKNGYDFYFLEEFCTLRMQWKALAHMLRCGRRFLKIERYIAEKHAFGDYNMYPLFKIDWYSSFVGSAGYSGLLFYGMFKSFLSKARADQGVYLCEMHAWEKALLLARDAVGSGTRLLAYQFGTVSPMLLNYFNHPVETAASGPPSSYPLPHADKIICNGPLPCRYLRQSGWPECVLEKAEAIRYTYLSRFLRSSWPRKSRNIVLLVLSLSPEESAALLAMTHDALGGQQEIDLWVKPHPMLDFGRTLELSGFTRQTFPYPVKEGPIDQFLREARIAIAGESGVSLEALALGCTLITLDVPEWINMSPLRHVESTIVKTVASAQRLREVVLDVVKQGGDPEDHRGEAVRLLQDFFFFSETDAPAAFLKLLEQDRQPRARMTDVSIGAA